MFIWEILNEASFSSFCPLFPNELPRLYRSRREAESAAKEIAIAATVGVLLLI